MVDARSLLDMLVRGSAQSQPGQPDQASSRGPAQPAQGSVEDMIRSLLGDKQGAPGATADSMSEMLSRLQQQAGPGAGAFLDMARRVLEQATSGVREGAARVDQATGASGHVRDAVTRTTGRSPDELLAQLKELVANNQLGTGLVLGGLGAILLGTGAGRALAITALKLGGAALIGGIAYNAYRNYRNGHAPGAAAQAPQALLAAPAGSGFEADDALAAVCIRAMFAAAAADGRIDEAERARILGRLEEAGVDAEVEAFFRAELTRPATPAELARGVSTPPQALQVYTAARLAIAVDTPAERAFLQALADALGIDTELAAQVDAEVQRAST